MTDKRFLLKVEHLLLIRAQCLRWDDTYEHGAPGVDAKRPYGNSAPIIGDIMEVLGEELQRCPHCDEPICESDQERFMELHRQTKIALRIVMSNAGKASAPGWYRSTDFGGDKWEREL